MIAVPQQEEIAIGVNEEDRCLCVSQDVNGEPQSIYICIENVDRFVRALQESARELVRSGR